MKVERKNKQKRTKKKPERHVRDKKNGTMKVKEREKNEWLCEISSPLFKYANNRSLYTDIKYPTYD
jgi:hypothetical protein